MAWSKKRPCRSFPIPATRSSSFTRLTRCLRRVGTDERRYPFLSTSRACRSSTPITASLLRRPPCEGGPRCGGSALQSLRGPWFQPGDAGKDFQSRGKENPSLREGKSKPGEAKSKLFPSANRAFSKGCADPSRHLQKTRRR